MALLFKIIPLSRSPPWCSGTLSLKLIQPYLTFNLVLFVGVHLVTDEVLMRIPELADFKVSFPVHFGAALRLTLVMLKLQSVFFYADYFICLLNLLTIIRNRWLLSFFNPFIMTFYNLNQKISIIKQ